MRNYRFGECLTAGTGDNGQICRFTIGHGILVFNNLGLSYSTLLPYFQVGKYEFAGQAHAFFAKRFLSVILLS